MNSENKTVLVVDDDRDFLEIVTHLLEENYSVVTAQSGADGLDAIKTQSVDVVVCDINMPCMNGLEFLAELKRVSPVRIPVMLVTAGVAPIDFHSNAFRADSFCLKQNLFKRILPEVKALCS